MEVTLLRVPCNAPGLSLCVWGAMLTREYLPLLEFLEMYDPLFDAGSHDLSSMYDRCVDTVAYDG